MSSTQRFYVKAPAPCFREQQKNQVKSLLRCSAPTLKSPQIKTVSNVGLEFSGTLRDMYIQCHGQRYCDDISVILSRKNNIKSQRSFTNSLINIPFYSYNYCFNPQITKQFARSLLKKRQNPTTATTNARKKTLLLPTIKRIERNLLHNNIRILLYKSSLIKYRDSLRFIAHRVVRGSLIRGLNENKKNKSTLTDNLKNKMISTDPNILKNKMIRITPTKAIQPRSRIISGLTCKLYRTHLVVSISVSGIRNMYLGTRKMYKRYNIPSIVRYQPLSSTILSCVLQRVATTIDPWETTPDIPYIKYIEPYFTMPITNTVRYLNENIFSIPYKVSAPLKILKKKVLLNEYNDGSTYISFQSSTLPSLKALPSSSTLPPSSSLSDLKDSSTLLSNSNILSTKTQYTLQEAQQILKKPTTYTRDSTPQKDVIAHTQTYEQYNSDPHLRIYDPFCNTGDIIIDSALKFIGQPPKPQQRNFGFENWPIHKVPIYKELQSEWEIIQNDIIKLYYDNIISPPNLLTSDNNITKNQSSQYYFPPFIGSDIERVCIEVSQKNAKLEGVDRWVQFYEGDMNTILQSYNLLTNKNGINISSIHGYTLLSVIPWNTGIKMSNIRGTKNSSLGIKGKDTQDDLSVLSDIEKIYIQFGKALYKYRDIFRDIYVLVSHDKFEKLTYLGALSYYRTVEVQKNTSSTFKELRWIILDSFYNQGIKTRLLRMDR